MHDRGTLTASVLTAAESDKGRFRALVSAYDVKYRIGWALWHTIEMGAFAASIEEQPAIPIYQQHSWSWSELPGIGHAAASEDTDEGGLVVAGELYIDDSETARVVWRQMLAGAIREWSIGYSVIASRRDPDDDRHEFVTEGELLEASAVLRGANPETRTLQVASATFEEGAAQDTRTRITRPDGLVIETFDQDLVRQLVTADGPPAPPPADGKPETFDGSSLLDRADVREMFGDALAGNHNK